MSEKDGVKLSLCMILKHEEKTIASTIHAVSPILSEIVIGFDKESKDGTREEITKLAKELPTIKWKLFEINLSAELAAKKSLDDESGWGFSKARNQVFSVADPNAWRIILDGHERVVDPRLFAAEIRNAIEAKCDCVDVTVYFEPANDGIPQSIFESSRAAAPGVEYVNSIHNVLAGKKHYKAKDVVIEHCKAKQAKESRAERNVQRSDSNINGLETKALRNPSDSRTWFYLATAYKENGMYEQAISAYDECLVHSKWHEERWTARMDKGHCLVIIGRKDEARTSYAMAIDEHSARAEAHYHLGDLAYNQKRFGEAEAWLEKCVSLPMPQCRLFLVPRVYWVMRHDLLSMVYHHTGKIKLAIEQAEIALEKVKDSRIARNVELWKEVLNKRSAPETGRSRSPIDLCSHKRSGTHFFMATLWHNFELPDVSVQAVIPKGQSFVDVDGKRFNPGDSVDIPWGGLWRTHGMWNAAGFDPKKTVYIVRHPFDTLRSYWQFTNPLNAPPLTPEMADKLVKHWYQQSLGYAESGCLVVKYEDLIGVEHDLVLMDLEDKCELKRKREPLERFETKVGWYSDEEALPLDDDSKQILKAAIEKIVPKGFLGYL